LITVIKLRLITPLSPLNAVDGRMAPWCARLIHIRPGSGRRRCLRSGFRGMLRW
jgi:hypothetical protein